MDDALPARTSCLLGFKMTPCKGTGAGGRGSGRNCPRDAKPQGNEEYVGDYDYAG